MGYHATNGSEGGESGLFKTVRSLGKALGVGVAILATPAVFNASRWKLFAYLKNAWGDDVAGVLVWVMAWVEGYVLYVMTTLVFSALVVWAMTAYAARQYSDGR